MLRKKGFSVGTTVFAAPGRVGNKRWQSFFKLRDLSFSPIPRNQKGEASDTAVEAKLAQLARSKRDICMTLLTCDNDFVAQARQIAALLKNDMWVFVPVNGDASLLSSLRRYKETGAHAVPLATSAVPFWNRTDMEV